MSTSLYGVSSIVLPAYSLSAGLGSNDLHVARAADHEQPDHALRLGREVGRCRSASAVRLRPERRAAASAKRDASEAQAGTSPGTTRRVCASASEAAIEEGESSVSPHGHAVVVIEQRQDQVLAGRWPDRSPGRRSACAAGDWRQAVRTSPAAAR